MLNIQQSNRQSALVFETHLLPASKLNVLAVMALIGCKRNGGIEPPEKYCKSGSPLKHLMKRNKPP